MDARGVEDSGSSDQIDVIQVDSRQTCIPSHPDGYTKQVVSREYFQRTIVDHPRMRSFVSPVSILCGIPLKLYFMKAKKGMAQYYREGGPDNCMRVLASNPGFLASNNGIASFLLVDPENGLPEWTVTGKCYVVRDGDDNVGLPLTVGQVWGIQEMVNCAMDIYDMDPENIEAGRETIREWSQEYRERTWEPRSGLGGMQIY